jgi:hypothetical protein
LAKLPPVALSQMDMSITASIDVMADALDLRERRVMIASVGQWDGLAGGEFAVEVRLEERVVAVFLDCLGEFDDCRAAGREYFEVPA